MLAELRGAGFLLGAITNGNAELDQTPLRDELQFCVRARRAPARPTRRPARRAGSRGAECLCMLRAVPGVGPGGLTCASAGVCRRAGHAQARRAPLPGRTPALWRPEPGCGPASERGAAARRRAAADGRAQWRRWAGEVLHVGDSLEADVAGAPRRHPPRCAPHRPPCCRLTATPLAWQARARWGSVRCG